MVTAGVAQATNGVAAINNGVQLMKAADNAPSADEMAAKNTATPTRVTNPKHHPSSASPEPTNVDEMFNNSIPDKQGVRWAKDADGSIHRFSKPSNGESHWNGSTRGAKPIQGRNIPNEIKKALKIKE
jgi:hypothetical protein